jgi:peptidyl-prolyl cis-trans isomerase B (cyclophilin B)
LPKRKDKFYAKRAFDKLLPIVSLDNPHTKIFFLDLLATNLIHNIMALTAEFHTAKGVMKAELYADDVPNTVNNFVKLAKSGFYDGLRFHRVIPDFVIQGGCPFSRNLGDPRTGTGGPGYSIKCETSAGRQYHDRGVLSMAHAGKDTGGSQFFICHNRENTQHLDGVHTCFGKVFEGLDVLDAIRQDDLIEKIVIVEE